MQQRTRCAYNTRVLDINALPDDVHKLKRLLLEHHAASLAKDLKLEEKSREIEHLKWQLAKLRRARFGQSSETFEEISQLSLTFEELAVAVEQAQRELEAPARDQVSSGHAGQACTTQALPRSR